MGDISITENWMRTNFETLRHVHLRDLCLPGSHDSGMSRIEPVTRTIGSATWNTVTQSRPVSLQLIDGVRYLDFRPVVGKHGLFWLGHYTRVHQSWQGASGQRFDAALQEISDFVQVPGRRELIVVSISHCLNTNVGNFSYRCLSQNEWHSLLTTITNIIPPQFRQLDQDGSFLGVELQNLIEAGSKVLFFIPNVRLYQSELWTGNMLENGAYGGIYLQNNGFNLNDMYSNTNDFQRMAREQIQRMTQNQPFLLSWILTLQPNDFAKSIAKGTLKSFKIPFLHHLIRHCSINRYAKIANSEISRLLLPNINQHVHPCVVLVDYFTPKVAFLSQVINMKRYYRIPNGILVNRRLVCRGMHMAPFGDGAIVRPSNQNLYLWSLTQDNEAGFFFIESAETGMRLEAFPLLQRLELRPANPTSEDQKWYLVPIQAGRYIIACNTRRYGLRAIQHVNQHTYHLVEVSNRESLAWTIEN